MGQRKARKVLDFVIMCSEVPVGSGVAVEQRGCKSSCRDPGLGGVVRTGRSQACPGFWGAGVCPCAGQPISKVSRGATVPLMGGALPGVESAGCLRKVVNSQRSGGPVSVH